MNKYEEAIQDFLKAIEINPNDYIAFTHYGEVLLELKQFKEAIQIFNKAIEIKQDFYGVRLYRGLSLEGFC